MDFTQAIRMSRTEAQTRKDLIDTKLYIAGWNVNDPVQVIKELDIKIGLPDSVEEIVSPFQGGASVQ